MSQIISFSADRDFAAIFDDLIQKSGYKNRSRFIRDAALYFAEIQQKGDLMNIADSEVVEGHLVVHYEHGSEQKLMVTRTESVEVAAYHHSSRLGHSCHSCVDVVHVKGEALHVRTVFEQLKNTRNVDKVVFVSAPMREEECC
ncbi:MAG: ribbon-helix-helix protein, CopG family [Candidatus Thermoplasmatota archaeon]|nr:ribbon-helix-helix protein, CopG family [Candidatus Thermoplasmatota archaeon]